MTKTTPNAISINICQKRNLPGSAVVQSFDGRIRDVLNID